MSASARQVGHTISLYITAVLMLLVLGVLVHSATFGNRQYAPTKFVRWGPSVTMVFAALLIMCEPTRHVINDANIWPWCGNNPQYDRINSTDAFPPQCMSSATQYVCTQTCCVSTWQPNDAAPTEYKWYPETADFYPDNEQGLPGPFATERPDGTLYFPPDFDKTEMPFSVYTATSDAPLAFYETGDVNPLRANNPQQNCKYGVNKATGYCFLTDQKLSYEDQLKQLPLSDPSKPFNATTNPHVCACDACVPDENMLHLSVVGVISSIVCTYTGFALLAIAVGWNASIMKKLRRIPQQWRALREGRPM